MQIHTPTPQATVNNHFHGAKISLGISLQKRKKKRKKRKKKKVEEFRPHFIYFFYDPHGCVFNLCNSHILHFKKMENNNVLFFICARW